MCLCWNPDGSLCGTEELKRRLQLYEQGLYKPELKAMRDAAQKKHKEEREARLPEIREKYKNYKWPWSKNAIQ